MHLVAETAPRVAVVRELGSQHYLADALISRVWLSVVPQIEEICTERMCSDNFLTILDDSLEVR